MTFEDIKLLSTSKVITDIDASKILKLFTLYSNVSKHKQNYMCSVHDVNDIERAQLIKNINHLNTKTDDVRTIISGINFENANLDIYNRCKKLMAAY